MRFISFSLLFFISVLFCLSQCPNYAGIEFQTGTCVETPGDRITNGVLNIDGNLTINGDFTVRDGGLIVNGTLIVTGNFEADASLVQVNGTMDVQGDYAHFAGVLEGGGSLDVDGTYTQSGGFDNGFTGTYNGGEALPVELVRFNYKLDYDNVILNWTTSSEINNLGFDVERSYDGLNFIKIGFIEGSGSTNAHRSYQYIDRFPTGVAYYRLKQVDFDGQFEYSSIIVVEAAVSTKLSVYPNPTHGHINILSAITNYKLYDANARLVVGSQNTTGPVAEMEISEVLIFSKPGTYFLHTETGRKKQVARIVKE